MRVPLVSPTFDLAVGRSNLDLQAVLLTKKNKTYPKSYGKIYFFCICSTSFLLQFAFSMIQLSILVSFFSVILICEYKSTPTAIIVPKPNPDPTITRRTMFGSIVNLTRVGHCDGEP